MRSYRSEATWHGSLFAAALRIGATRDGPPTRPSNIELPAQQALRVGEALPLSEARWHGDEPLRDLRRRVHAGVREHRAETVRASGLAAGVSHDEPEITALHRLASGLELRR